MARPAEPPILDESVSLIGADKVRAGTGLKRAYTGAGVNVAVIDTGVDGLHPDVPAGSKVEQYQVAGDAFEREPMTFTPLVTGDTYGHGTHVSSTIAGLGAASGGRYAGVAPGAKITSFKTDAGAVLLTSWALGSFDWILSHPEKGIRVSSNSWGSGDGTDFEPDNPVARCDESALRRGDQRRLRRRQLRRAEHAQPVRDLTLGDQRRGEHEVARPRDVLVPRPHRRQLGPPRRAADGHWHLPADRHGAGRPHQRGEVGPGGRNGVGVDPENPMYTTASGTSMATPHIAGTIALMLEARPGLKPANVIDVLEGTADDMPAYEIFEVGMGHLDAYGAVLAAEKGKIKFPPAISGKTPQFTLTSSAPFSGTALANTWQLAECPDTTPGKILGHKEFTVGTGVDVVYAEIEWADPNELIYLRLYDPNCQVAAESAALLDIGAVNHRALVVTSPIAGKWTVGVYGRVNVATQYTGAFSTYDKR